MNNEKTIKVIGDFWDQRAATFDKDHDTENADEWMKLLEELLGEDKSKNVLDLGTGSGFLANMTARLGYPTVGMDLSTEMMKYGVRHAAACGSGAMYMQGNALDMPLMDNTVDNIVNARLIWTIIEPDDMVREWLRVLRPGGRVFCFNRMPSRDKPINNVYDDESVNAALSIRNASVEEMTDLLLRNGYENVEVREFSGLTRPEFGEYRNWCALIGQKPVTRRYSEEQSIAAYWNSSAEEYDERHALADAGNWQKKLEMLIGKEKNQRILDVATGTGIIANLLGAAGYTDVTGTDISEMMMRVGMRHAEEQNTGAKFLYANAMELPIEDNSVDVLISSRLLWTLSEPEAALKEWNRVLKRGGRVIALNETENGGIRCSSMEGYIADTKAKEYPFSDISNEGVVTAFKNVGFANAQAIPLQGCRTVISDSDNWAAFVGTKE